MKLDVSITGVDRFAPHIGMPICSSDSDSSFSTSIQSLLLLLFVLYILYTTSYKNKWKPDPIIQDKTNMQTEITLSIV